MIKYFTVTKTLKCFMMSSFCFHVFRYLCSEALDTLGMVRYCCRRMLMTRVDAIEKLLLFNGKNVYLKHLFNYYQILLLCILFLRFFSNIIMMVVGFFICCSEILRNCNPVIYERISICINIKLEPYRVSILIFLIKILRWNGL